MNVKVFFFCVFELKLFFKVIIEVIILKWISRLGFNLRLLEFFCRYLRYEDVFLKKMMFWGKIDIEIYEKFSEIYGFYDLL